MTARLAIDPPTLLAGSRAPSPCQILDAYLRPIGDTMADGRMHEVPSGRLVLLITTPDGTARRKVLLLQPGGEYRLHYFRHASKDFALRAAALSDPETLRLMAYLQSGQVGAARKLCERHLNLLRGGVLGDPVAAAAVGYVLLQTWEYQALEPWCFDLPIVHPWLADGYVIAGECHANRGNHLTALTYLQQLERRPLPVFTLGLSRALDRLAVYQAQPVTAARINARASEHAGDRTMQQAQLLNPWDIEAAGHIHMALGRRSHGVDVWQATTDPAQAEHQPRKPSRAARLTQSLVGQLADRTTVRGRRARGYTGEDTMADPTTTAKQEGETRVKQSGISGLPLYVAIAAIGLWAVFAVVMFLLSDSDEAQWTRVVYIFGSVEAIAFAAAGALFGVTVQRERVERAERKADANERDAASGRALAAVNLADGGQIIDQDGESRYEAFGTEEAPDADVRRRHAEAARRLFPDL